jgi:hypothetical protein
MDKIEQCLHDVIAIATAFGGHDLAEARLWIETLFADTDKQKGGHFVVAQGLRDQLALALNNTKGPAGRQSLCAIIDWLQRHHLGDR